MKKMIGKARETMRQYWNNLMHSKRVRMPMGAQYISKMIAWARGENWRGKKEGKK